MEPRVAVPVNRPDLVVPGEELRRLVAAGRPVALQLWGPEGSLDSSTAHVELLAELLDPSEVRIVDVPVVVDDTEALEAAAGELVAWRFD